MFSALLSIGGCSPSYYWQAMAGHMSIVNGKQPVSEVLQNEDLQPEYRARLELSQQAVDFAHAELLLPDNGSYRSYYDTGEPYVVWNVFAAPELSLQPRTWCFPVAGCIAYRGYFKQDKASEYAASLKADGDDVFVGGVTAYSTLGRFRDPILNTMLDASEPDLVGLLFHELAHQQLYVQDDSAFNEGFASTVERAGLLRWQAERGAAVDGQRSYTPEQLQQVLELFRDIRARLTTIYAAKQDDATKRAQKQQLLQDSPAEYAELASGWQVQGLTGRPYQEMFNQGLNNASLSAVATYDNYVPAFESMLRQCSGQLDCFYERAAAVGNQDAEARVQEMQALLVEAIGQ
jgi:predicted aminopeptidase